MSEHHALSGVFNKNWVTGILYAIIFLQCSSVGADAMLVLSDDRSLKAIVRDWLGRRYRLVQFVTVR